MERFLEKTGNDMGNIQMEMEKLISYTMGREIITAEDIEAICTTQISNKIFEMVRAVAEKQQKKALDLYYDLLMLKEPAMKILFLLAKQFRQLLLVRRYLDEGMQQAEIASSLGVQTFVVRNLLSCAHLYEIAQLEKAIEDFAEMEEAVKTGRIGDRLSVELLIIQYSAAEKNK